MKTKFTLKNYLILMAVAAWGFSCVGNAHKNESDKKMLNVIN